MKKILLGLLAFVALDTAANAADLAARPYNKAPVYAAPVYNWGGFYVGANAGYGSDRNSWDAASTNSPVGSHNADGAFAGGQLGYRWQAGSWVWGLEAQGDWAHLTGSHLDTLDLTQRLSNRIGSFGLFAGQVGYAWSNTLLYVKGGAAVIENRYRDNLVASGALIGSVNDTRWAGTVGVGLEYGFSPNWSAAIEYDHIFADSNVRALNDPTGGIFDVARLCNETDLVMGKINYHFNWGGSVAAARY